MNTIDTPLNRASAAPDPLLDSLIETIRRETTDLLDALADRRATPYAISKMTSKDRLRITCLKIEFTLSSDQSTKGI